MVDGFRTDPSLTLSSLASQAIYNYIFCLDNAPSSTPVTLRSFASTIGPHNGETKTIPNQATIDNFFTAKGVRKASHWRARLLR